MIEVFGFWANVSVIVALASFIPLGITVYALSKAISHVTQDVKYGKAFMDLFVRDNFSENTTTFFKRFTIEDSILSWLLSLALVCSALFWMVAGIVLNFAPKGEGRWQPDSLVEMVSDTAQFFAPWTGPIAAIVIGYVVLVPVLRKAFNFYLRINAVLKPTAVEDDEERKAS